MKMVSNVAVNNMYKSGGKTMMTNDLCFIMSNVVPQFWTIQAHIRQEVERTLSKLPVYHGPNTHRQTHSHSHLSAV